MENLEKQLQEGLEAVKAQVNESADKSNTAVKEVAEKLEATQRSQTEMLEQIKEVSEDMEAIKEANKVNASEDMKNWLHSVVKENHKDLVEAIKNKKEVKFETSKVAAIHMTNNGTVTNIDGLSYPTNPNFTVSNDIATIRVPENFVLNLISNTQRAKVPEMDIRKQQLPTEGAVAITAEGAVKPLVQYKFQNTSTKRQKYAGRIEWTEEFEMDFEPLLRAIIRMFERDVLTAWQEGLFDIIETNSTAYVGSVLDGTLVNPDNGLAVVAAGLQIEALNYNITGVVMNPQDIASAYYTQDNNGNFSLKPYVDANGKSIGAGYRLIKNNRVPQGTAYIGDFTIYDEVHSGLIIRTGQYGTQLIENEYTLIGEVFSILNASPIDYKGIVKVNLATVKAALQKEPEA